MQNKYLEQNLEKVQKYVAHDILVNIYKNIKNNPEKEDLKSKIETKYEKIYKVAVDDKLKYPKNAFVLPEGREITTAYIDIVKQVCNDLGIDVKVNPTQGVSKNDYVILTDLKSIVTSNVTEALCSTNVIEDFANLPMHQLANILFKESADNIVVIQENSEEENKMGSALISRFVVSYIPDAPLGTRPDNVLSAMKDMREKVNPVNDNQVKLNK